MPYLRRLCFFFGAALLLTASAQQQDSPFGQDGSEQEMPVISDEDRQLILQGSWWDHYPSLLPDLSDPPLTEEEIGVAPSLVEQGPLVDSFPENFQSLHEQFLPEYIRQASGKLIDPQRLLGEIERDDALSLIGALEREYGLQIYVSVFAPGQEVPPEVNAPALARQIFTGEERSILLHVHYGEVTSLQIACDVKWMESIGDQGRRALLARIKENASLYTDSQDSLLEAVAAMVLYAQPGMAEMLKVEQEAAIAQKAKVPPVDIDFIETEKEEKSRLGDLIKQMAGSLSEWAMPVLAGLGLLVLLGAAYLWRRNLRPVTLAPSEPDRRLGAPFGAGVSRVVSYGDKNDSNPDSIPRQQMRDHLKDIS